MPQRVRMTPTLVLNVVGMTPALLPHAPALSRLAQQGAVRSLSTVLPAVTTTVQSNIDLFMLLRAGLDGQAGFGEQQAVLDLIATLRVDLVLPGHGRMKEVRATAQRISLMAEVA